MTKDIKKKIRRGVKKALEKIMSDIDTIRTQYATFSEAVYGTLDDKTKGIIESYKEEVGKEETNNMLYDVITEECGEELFTQLASSILGMDISELKAAVDYEEKRVEYQKLLTKLSDITKIKKTDLILSIDYSKDVEERISRVEDFLGRLVKKNTEV